MALLWIDGFDWIASATGQTPTTYLALKYANVVNNYQSRSPRITSNGFALSGNDGGSIITSPILTSAATVVAGFGYMRNTSSSAHSIIRLRNSGTDHITLVNNSSGFLEVYRGTSAGTLLGTGTTQLLNGAWHYIEIKATINDSTGSVVVHIDENLELNLTGIDTRNGASAVVDSFMIDIQSNTWWVDDFYFLDTTGTANNDFLGDVQVQILTPSGAGTNTDFTPSTGSNYQNVDDIPYDSDTTYNSATVNGDTDTYAFSNITATSASVKGIDVNIIARKSLSGARTYAPVVRTNSTDFVGTDVSALDSYALSNQIYETNPDTSSAWLKAEVDAAEFGIQVTN